MTGGGWVLLITKVINSGEAFCTFTLLYFTGSKRILIQVCYPLRKKKRARTVEVEAVEVTAGAEAEAWLF